MSGANTIKFIMRLKLKNLNFFFNSNLFYKKNNFLLLNLLIFNKKQKFYLFNLIYSYQLNYIFLNKLNLINLFFNIKIDKFFLLYSQDIIKLIYFIKDLFALKNIKTVGVNYIDNVKYKFKNLQIHKLGDEYFNFYKKINQEIKFKNYIILEKNILDIQSNFIKNNGDIEYYLNDYFNPEFVLKDFFLFNRIKNNLNIFFIKIKINYISYNFFQKMIFFEKKLNFLDNFKNLIFFYFIFYIKKFIIVNNIMSIFTVISSFNNIIFFNFLND